MGALMEHYGSPGRLADLCQFEKEKTVYFYNRCWRSKPLGTWVILHNSLLYLTNLLPAMTVVLCTDIWIV